MATIPRKPHILTIDGQKYAARLPDIYDDIKGVVGIEEAPNPDNTVYAGKANVTQFIQEGDLVRIQCRLADGKYKKVLCVSEKFASAMAGLLTKKVGGVDVNTTGVPRRMRLG